MDYPLLPSPLSTRLDLRDFDLEVALAMTMGAPVALAPFHLEHTDLLLPTFPHDPSKHRHPREIWSPHLDLVLGESFEEHAMEGHRVPDLLATEEWHTEDLPFRDSLLRASDIDNREHSAASVEMALL
jgi:hypothetical protein